MPEGFPVVLLDGVGVSDFLGLDPFGEHPVAFHFADPVLARAELRHVEARAVAVEEILARANHGEDGLVAGVGGGGEDGLIWGG